MQIKYIIINFILNLLILGGINGVKISFIILFINIIFSLFLNKKKIKDDLLMEAHNFIRFTYESSLILNNDSFLLNSYKVVNKKYRLDLEKYSSNNEKLSYLERVYQYQPFSLLKKVMFYDIKKQIKIKIFEKIYSYSSYCLNYHNLEKNRLNLNKLYYSMLSINITFLLIRYLFIFQVDKGFYILFLIIFVIESIIIFCACIKKKKNNYEYDLFFQYFISLYYLTAFKCLEELIKLSKKKERIIYSNLLKDYKENNFDTTLSLIKNNSNDLMIDIYCFMYRVSLNNGIYNIDIHNLDIIFSRLENSKKEIDYKEEQSFVMYLLLIGILYFIYNILVRYGTF